jgi:hypothetical protein
VAKDILLVDAIAEKQTQVFSDECKLFPADVPITSYSTMYVSLTGFVLIYFSFSKGLSSLKNVILVLLENLTSDVRR